MHEDRHVTKELAAVTAEVTKEDPGYGCIRVSALSGRTITIDHVPWRDLLGLARLLLDTADGAAHYADVPRAEFVADALVILFGDVDE